MQKLIFILGSPNSADGILSPISLSRIIRAMALQRDDREIVLLATGGFGDHFNASALPHRDLIHQNLLGRGASIDVAGPTDLLSSNTVEDALMIAAFAEARGSSAYGVVTSTFHAARCRFIFDCLDPKSVVDIFAADDPLDVGPQVGRHETAALAQLVAQGGVLIGGILHAHRGPLPDKR